jgi:hypothetical protein
LMAEQSITLAHSALGLPHKVHGAHVRIAEVETGIEFPEGNECVAVEHIEAVAGTRKSIRTSRRFGRRWYQKPTQTPSGPILLLSVAGSRRDVFHLTN